MRQELISFPHHRIGSLSAVPHARIVPHREAQSVEQHISNPLPHAPLHCVIRGKTAHALDEVLRSEHLLPLMVLLRCIEAEGIARATCGGQIIVGTGENNWGFLLI